jgi:hypothetical protein
VKSRVVVIVSWYCPRWYRFPLGSARKVLTMLPLLRRLPLVQRSITVFEAFTEKVQTEFSLGAGEPGVIKRR